MCTIKRAIRVHLNFIQQRVSADWRCLQQGQVCRIMEPELMGKCAEGPLRAPVPLPTDTLLPCPSRPTAVLVSTDALLPDTPCPTAVLFSSSRLLPGASHPTQDPCPRELLHGEEAGYALIIGRTKSSGAVSTPFTQSRMLRYIALGALFDKQAITDNVSRGGWQRGISRGSFPRRFGAARLPV